MNRYDISLVVILVLLVTITFFLRSSDNPKQAIVSYDSNVLLTIDLSDKTYRTYHVNGYNGDILIETVDGKIRVVEENSPRHLCSKQGYIENSYESIVCLPNKVVIEIEDADAVDTVVK